MTRGRRLAAALVVVATVLLVGRGVALLFSDHEWYAALGATSVWRDKLASTALLYGVALAVGTAFAWVNLTAVRRSVLAVVVPKRVGNVEFGEEVPSGRLRVVTLAMSAFIAAASTLALPPWTTVALWRSDVTFGELDPYFELDLGHYVAWLPLERAAYDWSVVLFATVALLVVALYSLTPGLRWTRRGIRVSTRTRRHVAALAAVLLLIAAWGFRLSAFDLLSNGSGPGGAFTRTDHTWLIPADLVLSMVTVAAAPALLFAGWIGQTGVSLVVVTVVLLGAAATGIVGPRLSAARAAIPALMPQEAAYMDIRDIYTRRAFDTAAVLPSARTAVDSGMLAAAGYVTVQGVRLPAAVYPGASGLLVERDPQRVLHAPRLGSGSTRLLNAWALQNPRLLGSDIPASAALLTVRDVRARVTALAPVFAQSRAIGAAPSASGIVWIVDLFATSGSYPLSAAQQLGRERVTYSHHAGTAYVSGGTGAAVILPPAAADPVTRAWLSRHPGSYIVSALPAEFNPAATAQAAAAAGADDSTFRARITRIYDRMREALSSGSLPGFAAAFDSLGRAVHPDRRPTPTSDRRP